MPRVLFDTRELYFLTQYLPVRRALLRRGAEVGFVAYNNRPEVLDRMRLAFERAALPVVWCESKEDGLAHYQRVAPDWVVCGNSYRYRRELPPRTRTAMLYHGIGMKSDVYSPGLVKLDVRFVEGPHYTRELRRRFPAANLVEVGYAKVDPLFWPAEERPRIDLAEKGLDPARPTLLYAPTHSPSSFGRMADDWPAEFRDYNLLVKPHFLSYVSSQHADHRRKMERWKRAPNVYVATPDEFDPLPLMAVSDLLISDASSVLFEFAATDRPVVWCDFLKLPWTRRGIFRHRLKKRMDETIDRYRDIGAHAARYPDLLGVVRAELAQPGRHSAARRAHTAELVGPTDGRVSERIADYLLGAGTPPADAEARVVAAAARA